MIFVKPRSYCWREMGVKKLLLGLVGKTEKARALERLRKRALVAREFSYFGGKTIEHSKHERSWRQNLTFPIGWREILVSLYLSLSYARFTVVMETRNEERARRSFPAFFMARAKTFLYRK